MIFVNFKTYKEATGKNAVELVHKLCDCQIETGVTVIPVVQATDLRACVEASDGEVWVQHVDPVEYGQFTGWILPESVMEAGAKGTFLNHSEHKLEVRRIKEHILRCQEVGLKTLLFASTLDQFPFMIVFKPTYIALEPPELIASPTTSVAKARPDSIVEAAEITKSAGIPLIVGAGIKDAEDVKKSLELGAIGVAVSSSVVLASDPQSVVLELVRAFK